jgi:hypothetical protein
VTDNLELSGVTIESLIMGLASSASGLADVGIMGVGFDTNEASTKIYPNLIDEMVSQGLIDGHVFSLWLDVTCFMRKLRAAASHFGSTSCATCATVYLLIPLPILSI